jgi:adenine deaminase
MKLLIREGSAAGNLGVLAPLIDDHPDFCMFCSDDKHPNDLVEGHINGMAEEGYSMCIDTLRFSGAPASIP